MHVVPPTIRRHGPALLAVAVWLAGAVHLIGWVTHNPLPDGFQNEYLHIGNAYDLWHALVAADTWHMRWYMYTGYWPWGFYAAPWPALGLLGTTQLALVSSNLLHLGAMCWGSWRLGRVFDAPLAPLLLALCPGVFGTLVRYEPNLATIGWTIAGVACLVSSRGLRERKWVLGWGACLGLGLMFDRLTVGFFLIPAVVPIALGADRRALRHLMQAGVLTLMLTAAYYREFFLRHTEELLGQAPVGEIDAAGQVTATGGIWPALYYPLTLIDSQAGAIIGLLMVGGLVVAAVAWTKELRQGGWSRARTDPHGPLLAAVLPAMVLFSLIAKKQVYYTLPILGPLAVLAGARGRWAWLGVAAGLHGFVSLGWGWLPQTAPTAPFLPRGWVSPRHSLAQPPSRETWPLDLAARDATSESRPADSIIAMSEDHRLYEGYLALALRERLPGVAVRGVTTDPNGTYELMAEQDALVWVGAPGGGWPTAHDIKAELMADHYNLAELPPVADAVAKAADQFEEVGRHRAHNEIEVDIVVYRRVRPAPNPARGPTEP